MLRTFDDIYETMPWDAVDAVVFDVGQVLLSYNPQEILDEHVPDRPDLHPILLEKIFRSPYWLMRDHGLMTRDEAIEAMIGRDEPLRPCITRVMHGRSGSSRPIMASMASSRVISPWSRMSQ